jgi:hypothetical protein
VNEVHAEKIIELLENIDKNQKALLDEQRKSDEEMRNAISSLPLGQEEEEEKKSTEAYFNQGLVQAAKRFEATSPWSS